MRIFLTGAGERGGRDYLRSKASGERRGRGDETRLTLSLLGLLVVAGGVRLQRVAAAVERVVPVFVVEDPREADLPLVAMAAELRVQTQTAAVQVLQHTLDHLGVIIHPVLFTCVYFLRILLILFNIFLILNRSED